MTRLAFRLAAGLPIFALTCLQAAPALAQKLGGASDDGISIWRVLAALLVCLGLAVGVAYGLRHKLRGAAVVLGQAERRLQLIETVRLSHQVDVCLMRCGDEDFVLTSSPYGVVVVSRPGEKRDLDQTS